jgi:hypothetical protein
VRGLLLLLSACSFGGATGVPPEDADRDGPVVPDGAVDGAPGDAAPDGLTDAAIDAAIDAPPPDAAMQELRIPIARSSDDALQDPAPGNVLLTHQWISLYTNDHWGGLRFQVADIARGATIVDAWLELRIDTAQNEDDPNVRITAQAAANPGTFVAQNGNVSSRPRGTNVVGWQANDIGLNQVRRTPSIAILVRERVTDPNWQPGNSMVFIFDTQGPSFEFRQWDYAPTGTFAPVLVVQYVNP